MLADETLDTVYLLSSGEPDTGLYVHWNRVTRHLADMNRFHKVVVHTVAYTDNAAVRATSLGLGDIRVHGPGGFSTFATLVGVSPAGDGTPRTATYRIIPPGGTWDPTENGIYTVELKAV